MASTGIFSKKYQGYTYRITWSANPNVSGNYSTITCIHELICDAYWGLAIGQRTGTCTIVDIIGKSDVKSFTSNAIDTAGGETISLGKTMHTVYHKPDGTGSFSFTSVFNMNATIDGVYVSTFTVPENAPGSATLNPIPKSSTIISATDITLGNSCSIKWIPASSDFKYKIKFALKNWSYTTDFITPNRTTVYEYVGDKNSSETKIAILDIYEELPTTTSGTMTAVLTTYDSNGSQVGTTSSKAFTVTIPETVAPNGDLLLRTNPSDSILVQNKKVLTLEAYSWSPGHGSKIKSYTFSGPGVSETTSVSVINSKIISESGDLTYTVTVTDTRERTNSATKTIICYPYSTPYFKTFNAYRADQNGLMNMNGAYIKCTYDIVYSYVNGTNNIKNLNILGGTDLIVYSELEITQSGDFVNGHGEALINLQGNTGSTYKIYATIEDLYNSSSSSEIVTVFGSSRVLNITRNGAGVAIGKMAKIPEGYEGIFESRWPIKAHNGIECDGSINVTDDINAKTIITPDSVTTDNIDTGTASIDEITSTTATINNLTVNNSLTTNNFTASGSIVLDGNISGAGAASYNALVSNLGGLRVEFGSFGMPYASGGTSKSVTFKTAFSVAPTVVVQQVFNSTNVLVYKNDVTVNGFTAKCDGGFSSSGTRDVMWIAIGKD